MTFAEHIRTKIFEPRLLESRILVVFDPDGRYEAVCDELGGTHCTVIKAAGHPLSARLKAMETWQAMGKDTTHASTMVIYSRESPPKTNDEKVKFPFSNYAAMGAQFPDGAPDDYHQICVGFLPDRRTEIEQLFEGDTPEFQHIDNLAGGEHSHPRLEAIFGTGEVTRIVEGFLVPTELVSATLGKTQDWCGELKGLLDRTLNFPLNQQVTNPDTIRAKLWQYLLFSEFADDLPGKLPASLESIPKATGSAARIAADLCQSLRSKDLTREAYREAANAIEKELDLVDECEGIHDLGKRDTFAFEEARFLKYAVTCIKAGDLEKATAILNVHSKSLWTEEGERQLLWTILRLTLNLLGSIQIGEAELAHLGPHGIDLVQLYTDKLSRVDCHQRELDMAILQLDEGFGEVEAIINQAHEKYRNFANRLQEELIPAVQREGWPLNELPSSRDTFDEVIAPLLNDGKRVAYFLMDAFRLEVGQNLSDNLSKDFETEIEPVCAQLPCVTRFGMAALLPGAGADLKFREEKGTLEPYLGDQAVGIRSNRLKAFEKHCGDRVKTFSISEMIKKTKSPAMMSAFKTTLENTDLLVVTSAELDSVGEGEEWLRQHLGEPVTKLLRAVRRAGDLGFEVAVVATDHGFLWVDEVDAGTGCDKPIGGEWPLQKRRCFIGTGDEPHGSVKFSTAAVGIPCSEPSFIVPRSIGVYTKGSSYFHEGLSLPESLIGRMVVHLSRSTGTTAWSEQKANLELTRKRSKVSSLIVAVNLSWPGDTSLFADATLMEFVLVASQGGEEIGRPTANENVDPVTERVRLGPGMAIKLNVRLSNDIKEGPFKVKVLDIKTDKALATLDLNYAPNVL